MNTCIACCANRSRVHTLSSFYLSFFLSFSPVNTASSSSPVGPLFIFAPSPFRSPACFLSSRLSFRSVVSPSSLAWGGEPNRRALFIQLPYLNVVLTRRKIICKNPHKICKSPLMHREIVALYRRAYGIIISQRRYHLPPSITLVTKKGALLWTR